MHPYEGALTIAGIAKEQGYSPSVLRLHPFDYKNLQLGLNYQHEYIDEGECSYLVLRIPERLLVRTHPECKAGIGRLYCLSPDTVIEATLAT